MDIGHQAGIGFMSGSGPHHKGSLMGRVHRGGHRLFNTLTKGGTGSKLFNLPSKANRIPGQPRPVVEQEEDPEANPIEK